MGLSDNDSTQPCSERFDLSFLRDRVFGNQDPGFSRREFLGMAAASLWREGQAVPQSTNLRTGFHIERSATLVKRFQ